MNDLVWTKKRLGAFIELACLSRDEIDVLTDWANRKDPTWSADHLHMSKSKVEHIRTRLRRYYDVVQQEYPDMFPERQCRKLSINVDNYRTDVENCRELLLDMNNV